MNKIKKCLSVTLAMATLVASTGSIAYAASQSALGYPIQNAKLCRAATGYPNYPNGGYHGGLDIACNTGTKVYACATGKVIVSKNLGNKGYGQYIQIKHKDGKSTIYAHLSSRAVKTGDAVTRGQYIGKTGASGAITGPRLHLEYRTEANSHTKTLDPRKYFGSKTDYKYKNVTFNDYTTYSTSPFNKSSIAAIPYDNCKTCIRSNNTITSTGKKLANTGKYYDSKYNYVACDWLPYGTKINVTFPNAKDIPAALRGKTLTYTVDDNGVKGVTKANQLGIYIPNAHSKSHTWKTHNVKIKIVSMPEKYATRYY